jgi:hypothetical protein
MAIFVVLPSAVIVTTTLSLSFSPVESDDPAGRVSAV